MPMRPADDGAIRAWPLGSPTGYVQGAVLLLVAAGFAYALMVSTHLRPDDRFILAIVAVLTIGPFGIVAILRPAVRRVLLERDRVCIREWTFERRCVAFDRIRRVTWSYQYVSHFLDRIDRGRAWVELEVVSETGRCARICAASRTPRPGPRPPRARSSGSGEGYSMRAREGDGVGTSQEDEVFAGGLGARGVGVGCLVSAAVLVALTVAAGLGSAREGDFAEDLAGLLLLLVLSAIGGVLGLYYIRQQRNRRIRLDRRGVHVTNTQRHETFIAWDQITGMRWAHTHGKHQRGSVRLELLRASGLMERMEIAGYWGPLPGEIIALRGAIIRRLGLVQVEATGPGWAFRQEEVVWRRPDEGTPEP